MGNSILDLAENKTAELEGKSEEIIQILARRPRDGKCKNRRHEQHNEAVQQMAKSK